MTLQFWPTCSFKLCAMSFYILTSETRSQYQTIVLQIIIEGQRQTDRQGVKTDGGHSTELKMSHIKKKNMKLEMKTLTQT